MQKRETFEYSLRALFDNARWYKQMDPRTAYEANNALSRLVINFASFTPRVNDSCRLFYIGDGEVDREILDKFESEMREKNVSYNLAALIRDLNQFTPFPYWEPIHIRAPPETKTRVFKRFKQVTGIKSYEKFLEHFRLVYMRYCTFNMWTQCWTYDPEDAVPYDDKSLKRIELFGAPFNTQVDTYKFGTLFPDIDGVFGGDATYSQMVKFIQAQNEQGERFNIQIAPPNVPRILDDLVNIIPQLQHKNRVMIMFPYWTDHDAYIAISKMFSNHKIITRYVDMWTGKPVTGKAMKSTLFW